MTEIGGTYYRRPKTIDPIYTPDLSLLPAYVEPPRQRQTRPDRTPWLAIAAIFTGTAVVVTSFFGFEQYANRILGPAPGLQRTAEVMPPLQMPMSARDVPMPAGMALPLPPPPPPPVIAAPRAVSQAGHPTRVARPSHG